MSCVARLSWRHISVKFKTAGGTITKEIQYYDAYNNLVRRRLDADGAGGGGFTEKLWIYDGDEAILEFASGTATAPSHRYLWGPAVDQILADEQVATGSPSDVRWPRGRLAGHGPRRGHLQRRDQRHHDRQPQGLRGLRQGLFGVRPHRRHDLRLHRPLLRRRHRLAVEHQPLVRSGRRPVAERGSDWILPRAIRTCIGMWETRRGCLVDPSGLDGAGSAGMLGMAENYAQKGPTPVDAFIGSLATQAGDLLSTYAEGIYYLVTQPIRTFRLCRRPYRQEPFASAELAWGLLSPLRATP